MIPYHKLAATLKIKTIDLWQKEQEIPPESTSEKIVSNKNDILKELSGKNTP